MLKFRKLRRYWEKYTHQEIGEVWMLHRVREYVTNVDRLRPFEITPIGLINKIEQYIHNGYEFVSIQEAYSRMCQKGPINKFVCVTLDDGYEDNYHVAYPIFKKYNVPFCIYVAEKLITQEKEADSEVHYDMLTLKQLRALDKDPLCTIGSHTASHVRLNELDENTQREEIVHAHAWLESVLEHVVEDFAYPYGCRNDHTESILKEIGIQRAPVAFGGKVLNKTARLRYAIPRVLITD